MKKLRLIKPWQLRAIRLRAAALHVPGNHSIRSCSGPVFSADCSMLLQSNCGPRLHLGGTIRKTMAALPALQGPAGNIITDINPRRSSAAG